MTSNTRPANFFEKKRKFGKCSVAVMVSYNGHVCIQSCLSNIHGPLSFSYIISVEDKRVHGH